MEMTSEENNQTLQNSEKNKTDMNKEHKELFKTEWYNKWYKLMLLLPVILFVFSLIYLGIFYNEHGDFMIKDSSLAGGSTITIRGNYDSKNLEDQLKQKHEDLTVRTVRDRATGNNIAIIVDSSSESDILKEDIEEVLQITLTDENSSIEFSGPSLGNSFYKQLITALIVSFILMSLVIFFLFRTFVPSIAVVFAAFADIVMTLTFIDLLGIKLSSAGIAAFLMLIGYSVDTDILLTTRVLKKREGSVNQRIYSSFKTGIFMTIAGLLAVLPAFFLITGLPDSFRQIFLILGVGLFADIINTWLTNAGIIKWYANKKKIE